MLFVLSICLAICAASAAPRDKWNMWSPYAGGFAYAGRPFSGAYAGAGAGFWPFGGFNWFDPFRGPVVWPVMPTPWYEGPNVCPKTKISEEPDELKEWLKDDDMTFSAGDFEHQSKWCRGGNNKYLCMERVVTNEGSKMIVTKYECCHGFIRAQDGSPGCVEVDLRYLMPTLRSMGATELVALVEKVGMADNFHNNNYTVFCPPNSVLETFQLDLEDDMDNEVYTKEHQQKLKKKTLLHSLLTSHLVPEFLKLDDLDDNYIFPTGNEHCDLRINVYFTPDKVVTANCVPVLSGDHIARNGMIHVVGKLLPTPSKTVADIIAGDFQFSILKGMLSKAGLVQTLRNHNGSFTVFAPTDSAITSALSSQSHGVENRCAVSVMKHHIVEHVICSAALPHQARTLNMIGELLSLARDSDNKLYIDGVQIVVRDLMATNGVVHIIDGLLSTRQTKSVSQVLEESGLTEFHLMLEATGKRKEFDSMDNVTFFIPVNEAVQGFFSNHLESLLRHNKSILDILMFHVVEGETELTSRDQTLESKLENATLKFQVQTKFPQTTPQALVQCATVLSADIKLCGGTLHVIDKLLVPPKLNVVELLEMSDGFSTMVHLLRATGLDNRLSDIRNFHTILAPTDDAFHKLGTHVLFRILENIDKATDFVKMHTLLGSVCCSHLKNDLLSGRGQTRSMDGSLLNLHRSEDGILMVGDAHIVDCDIVATNGVIHIVDTVVSLDSTIFLGGGYIENLFMIV